MVRRAAPVAPRDRPRLRSNRGALASLWAVRPRGLGRTLLITAIATHALGSLVAGTLDPRLWDRLLFWTCILIVAPLVGAAVAIFSAAFKDPAGG